MRSTTRRRSLPPLVGVAATVAFLGACSSAPAPSGSVSAPTDYTIDTPAPTKDAGDVVWATYREPATLDPMFAFDLADNTALSPMCESLLRMHNDMTYGDGLATLSQPSATEYDFTINSAARFWDGNPVTAEDVVFSLKRQADPAGGGYYGAIFDRVKSIEASGPETVKITLTEPDYWLLGELSSVPGVIIEKKTAMAQGKNYGTVSGTIMCSGPFKLDSWETGKGITMVPSTTYWDSSIPKPKLTSLTVIGAPDDATLTAGLKTGAIDGAYPLALSTLGQLESDSSVSVYQGPPYTAEAMVIFASKGPLADPKVRQAVSLAVDRKGLVNTLLRGAGSVPHALLGAGTWGTAADVFTQAYDALPALDQDMAKAKDLATSLNLSGQTVTIATSTGIPSANSMALAFKAACEAVGLTVKLTDLSPSNYVNLFIDPKSREGVDAGPTANYGDYADPSALYKWIVLPTGYQNYSGYSNPEVTAALNAARGEKDETARAQDVVKAQKIMTDDLVWIPMMAPNNVLIMNKKVTGAPATFAYVFSPWAAYLGGA